MIIKRKSDNKIFMPTGWLFESPNTIGPPMVGDVVLRNVWMWDEDNRYYESRKKNGGEKEWVREGELKRIGKSRSDREWESERERDRERERKKRGIEIERERREG